MVKIMKTTTIEAPPEKVFGYLEPMHLPEIWPSMVEVKDVEKLPDGGWRYRWVYKMAGIHFKGESETVEIVPNERRVDKTKGGIESTFIWTFKPEDGHTRVELEVDYTVPVPVLGKLAEPFVAKMNEREAETVLANLKDRLEA